jgi:glycosyltransferase involved in cell wall biosynthesis
MQQYDVPESRVICVYAGVDVKTRPGAENGRSCPDRYAQHHVLFVGTDWERQGGPDLVTAFRQVQAVYPDARLTLVGANPQIDLPNCQVVGRLSVAEDQFYYEQASLFCLPTKLEPFGIVFIEAMAHRLPIIATTVGAIPDFVEAGVNGRLIPPGDVDSLARSLINLLGDPERLQTYGENSYRLAKSRYNWSSVGAAIRNQITTTLGQTIF